MKLKTHKKISKQLLTTEGFITYRRYICRPADQNSTDILLKTENIKTVAPLDIALGVNNLPFKISTSMMLEIAYWAVKLDSYQETEDYFLRKCGIQISDDTIRNVVNFIGRLVFEKDCECADKSAECLEKCQISAAANKTGILYLQTDGAPFNTRTKDNNDSTWRENKLGLAFSSDNIYYWKNHKGEHRHRILKREYISFIGNVQEFKYHLLALALRAGYGQYKETVLLSDGATWIRNIKDNLFPDAQQILDLFHLKENVYEFAKQIFREDEQKYKPWAEETCQKLEEGKWETVLKDLEKYKAMSVRPGIVNLYTYICNNRDNIDYPAYKEKGYFVGSGAIESGNKIVLQNRLKLPGMRWNIETAQYVLALKAKLESGMWENFVIPYVYKKMGASYA